jgi:hypothetical protein
MFLDFLALKRPHQKQKKLSDYSLLFLSCTFDQQQKHKLCKGHSMNIRSMFGSNWASGFRDD